jgi:hypothetical protein
MNAQHPGQTINSAEQEAEGGAGGSYSGSYASPRGRRRNYQYSVTWFRSGSGYFWSAVVKVGARTVGRPWGTLVELPNTYSEGLVRAAVIECIEVGKNIGE